MPISISTPLKTLSYQNLTCYKCLKGNSFLSAKELLKHENCHKLDSKCKYRSANTMLGKNGLLSACGRLTFAPNELELTKKPILLHAKDHTCPLYRENAHRISVHKETKAIKTFVQQRYYVIVLRKTLQRIRYKCFVIVLHLKKSKLSWHRFLVAVFTLKTNRLFLPTASFFNSGSNDTVKNTNLTGSFPTPQLAIQHPAGHHSFNPEQVKFKHLHRENHNSERTVAHSSAVDADQGPRNDNFS